MFASILIKSIFRDYTTDLVQPLRLLSFVPTYPSLSIDHVQPQLLTCTRFNSFPYKFRSSSLPDLTQKEYQIHFDLHLEKRNVKYQRMLNEAQWNDEDYHSELNDIGIE